MKAGLVTSVALHAALLGFGLVSLSAPRAFEAVESPPVDIVPIESITQVQQGEREAELAETPAPTPTERPEPVEEAEEIGDNEQDLPTPPTPEAKPKPVETAAARPEPADESEPEPRPARNEEEAPVPATETRAEPQPRQEVEPDPVAETIVNENAEAEEARLPETAPMPEARPRPPEPRTAKAPERKESDEPARREEAAPRSEDSEDFHDEVAALLNQEEASGGGAKRSEQTAALGTEQDSEAQELTQSELDALRQQLSGCWNRPVGAEGASDLRASVVFNVDRSGSLEGRPRVVDSSGHRQFDESAVRAIELCNNKGLTLPEGKEEVWAEIRVNFDPSEMF